MYKSSNSYFSWKCFSVLFLIPTVIAVLAAIFLKWTHQPQPPILSPVIQTANGPVQGQLALSRDGKEYWQFLGIPYATPPTGERRFSPPEPLLKKWSEPKQVINWPEPCAHYDGVLLQKSFGQFDCLHLNVFVSKGGQKSKSVLVWVHGGAFMSGSAKMYHPDYFMDQDVIMVVMNYRLGPFGFLNLESEQGPKGNMGLLDQNLALQWVQKNIANFGGNPEKVTLIGESAGAVSVHLHVISPMSKGLFHKAIIQSSPALSPWSFNRKPLKLAKHYAKRVNCSVDSVEEVRKCYEETDWQTLVKYQRTLMEPLDIKDLFEPTIDGKFLNDTPGNLLSLGRFSAVPVMFGVNEAEGAMRTARYEAYPELITKLDVEWNNLLENSLIVDEPVPEQIAMQIRKHYFGKNVFVDDIEGFMQNFTDFNSDVGFFWPTHKSAIFHAKRGAPVYLYYFNYTSGSMPGFYSVMRAARMDDWLPAGIKVMMRMGLDWVLEYWMGQKGSRPFGVMHGEDGFQMWNVDGVTKYLCKSDIEFSRDFVKAIVDFARDTKPLTFRNVNWPDINAHLSAGGSEDSIPYMIMDNEPKPKVVPEPYSKRIKFWLDLKGWQYQ